MPVSVQTCLRASLYMAVFLLVAGFVSPGFLIESVNEGNAFYVNVWYTVLCSEKKCETVRNNYQYNWISGTCISAYVAWAIMATLAVVMAIVAVIIDVLQRRWTDAIQGQRKLELAQFIILLLTSFQALMVCFEYAIVSIGDKQQDDTMIVKFPPSTVAYGLAGVLLLINIVERYILHNNRTPMNEQPVHDSNYRQFE